MSYVVDASVAVKWYLDEPLRGHANQLLEETGQLHAPELLVSEVANTSWKRYLRGDIAQSQAWEITASILDSVLQFHPVSGLIKNALGIALTLNHPVYDCLYIACAEQTGSVLVTADARLCNAVTGTAFASRVQHLTDFAAQ